MGELLHKSLAEVREIPITELVLWHAYGSWKEAQRET